MHVSLNYGLEVMINQMVLKTGFKMIIAYQVCLKSVTV